MNALSRLLNRFFGLCRFLTPLLWWRRPSFAELAAEVLEQKKLRAPGTQALAKIVLARLTGHFGSLPIRRLEDHHWRAYVLQRQAQRPGCSLFDDKKYMSQVVLLAVRRGKVRRKIELPIPAVKVSGGREIRPLEIRRLRKAAFPELRFQIDVALKMGLRRKEMLSLRWDFFDWENRTVRIYSTKTNRERVVPINSDLVAGFTRRKRKAVSPYVFPSRHDLNRHIRDHKTAWQACKRRAGVAARWNDLRHTCATVMLRRGASVSAVARMLGHSKRVLLTIYEHLDLSDLRRATETMSDRSRTRRARRPDERRNAAERRAASVP